jgi:uncharacterized FlaG/YvyC family protein
VKDGEENKPNLLRHGDETMAIQTPTQMIENGSNYESWDRVGNMLAVSTTKDVIVIEDIRTGKIVARIPKEIAMDVVEVIESLMMDESK